MRTPGAVVGLVLVGAIVLAGFLRRSLPPTIPDLDLHDRIRDGPVMLSTGSAPTPRPRHVQPGDLRCANLSLARLDLVSIACLYGLLFGVTAGYLRRLGSIP